MARPSSAACCLLTHQVQVQPALLCIVARRPEQASSPPAAPALPACGMQRQAQSGKQQHAGTTKRQRCYTA